MMMSRKLNIRKKTAAASALLFAGAMIFSSSASAIGKLPGPRDPVCDQQKANECVSTWQTAGYWNYDHCVASRQCQECPPWFGYMCGVGPNYATEPNKAVRAW
jgi:hypothetical protein